MAWWNLEDLRTEQQQLIDEGRQLDEVEGEFARLLGFERPEQPAFQEGVEVLLDRTSGLPLHRDYAYLEPSDLEGIHAQRLAGPRRLVLHLDEARQLLHISGAWLGHCAGCLLGKPIEGIRRPKLMVRNPYREWIGAQIRADFFGYVALGLLYGEGDFEKSITRAVLPCLDTDCNSATVGSILGMMLGVEALPAKWTSLMNDTVYTSLAGYPICKISELSREMFELHRAVEEANQA